VVSAALDVTGETIAAGLPNGHILLLSSSDSKLERDIAAHSGSVTSIAFSEATIISGGVDRIVKLWNATNGSFIRQMTGHSGAVYSAKLSPNGQYLVSGAAGNQLFLWNAQTGGIICAFWNHLGAVRAVTFTPNGEDIIAGDDGINVIRWQISGLILIRNYSTHKGEIDEVAFSPDGKTLASASADGMVKLWRYGTLFRTFNFGAPVCSIDFSPNGAMIAVGGGITTKIYNVANGGTVGQTFHGGVSMGVVFAPDSQTLYSTCTGGEVKRILPSGTEQWLVHLAGPVLYAAVSNSGNYVAVATLHSNSSQVWTVIRILNPTNGAEMRSWIAHFDYIRGLAFTRAGKLVAVFSDGTMRAWNPDNSGLLWSRMGTPGINDFSMNSTGDMIVTGQYEDIRFYREADGAQVAFFDRGFPWAVNAVAFSPDERLFSYGLDTGTFASAQSPFYAPVTAATLVRGSTVSGSVNSLSETDSGYWKLKPGPVFSQSEAPVVLILSGQANSASASRLSFKITSAASDPSIRQDIELYNFNSNLWEQVDSRLITTSDARMEVTITTAPSRFINGATREVRSRLSYRQVGPVATYPWQVRLDQAFWIANP
jgi:WD40 repeat protein